MSIITTTANNIIHANENARKREAAEKRAMRNAAIGGATTLTAVIAGMISSYTWKKKYFSLERRLNDIEKTLYGKQDNDDVIDVEDFTEGGDDNNG